MPSNIFTTPVASPYAWALVVVLAAAVLSFFVSFQIGVFALFFSLLAVWAWQSPIPAFWFFVVTSVLLPMFKVTQSIGAVTLLKDVLIITLFIKLFALPLLTQKLPYRRSVLIFPIITLAAWSAIAAVRADNLLLGVLRLRDIGLYMLLYFVALYLPRKRAVLAEGAMWLLATAAVVMLLGAYQWFFAIDSAVLRFDPVRSIWIPRLSSTFAHPSVYGQYLIVLATITAAIFAILKKPSLKWGSAVIFLTALFSIYLTYSRAVWLGLVAALGAAALAYSTQWIGKSLTIPWRKVAGVFVVLIVLAIGVVRFTAVGTFLGSAFDVTYKSNAERLVFMARLIGSTSNTEALFGHGLGDVIVQNFREVNVTGFDIASGASRSVQVAKDRTLVDNQHLKSFIELGLLGLLLQVWLYWRFWQTGWRLTQQATPEQKILGLVGVGFLAAFMLQGFFIDIWDIFPTNAYFWIIAGLMSAWSLSQKGEKS
ncbi:MAG: O-antigen ligase family protein [Candidatus Andersenbacteria bacterium]